MPEDPDKQLISAIAEGSEHALRELMERHKDAVFRFAYRWTRNEADAAEIAAETFVRVHRHAARYTPRAKVVTWIYSITANLCRDHARKAWRRKVVSFFSAAHEGENESGPSPEERIADTRPTADVALLRSETTARALALVDALPPKLKGPFVLQVMEENSQRECAEILGITEKAVETRVYRARKRIIDHMRASPE